MFSKKSHLDVKKSTVKIQDIKKDFATRLKHLKIILENVDIVEAKGIFEANYSPVYHILYDSFLEAENHLRQKELSFHLVHKAHKEELENALWVLENVLCLLPELLHKRWQLHSLSRILAKLLHPGNSIKIRRQAIRYFLMWYQALGENAPEYVNRVYANLVPNFRQDVQDDLGPMSYVAVVHDSTITVPEILPILPSSVLERVRDQSKLFLDTLLENMVTTVVKLEWHDKIVKQQRSFGFLLEKFKVYYLPKLCPNFCFETTIYNPNLDLPSLRKAEADSEFVNCRVSFIKWIANHMHQMKKPFEQFSSSVSTQNSSLLTQTSQSSHDEPLHQDSTQTSIDSNVSTLTSNKSTTTEDDAASQIVRETFYSCRENVNFIHEVYRQAFLLNLNYAVAIRRTIAVYKDIIQQNLPELPPYALELPDDVPRFQEDNSSDNCRPIRLRNDSYLGAIHKENLLVRAGLQNVLQAFVTHAAHVFFCEVSPHSMTLLDDQTDACKRVLNIYRYMVMYTRMDSNTWEQLLLILLQITSLVLNETPPKRKSETLGGKLAPAIFQTLIVTWIKANLNVSISRDLWDRFLQVLTSLTKWEELIREWAKTLETLTRVVARQVYNLDLTDLPLDRLSEQKNRKSRRGTARSDNDYNSNVSISRSSITSGEQSSNRMTNHYSNTQTDHESHSHSLSKKLSTKGLSRSYSETNLSVKSRSKKRKSNRRYYSLDNLNRMASESRERSRSRTRTPSPAPSSGIESSSMKDSPIQLDVLSSDNNSTQGAHESSSGDQSKGVVCGGSIRGWLPDVAVILWKRMLGALGDVNKITDPKLHANVFDYLIKLTETLIKIKLNQGVTVDNQSTPTPPELVPPLTLIVPWCFEALTLSNGYDSGKLLALKLLCIITTNCDERHANYLPQFYRSIHEALCGSSKQAVCIVIKHLGPRFLSLQLPGSSLLTLDLIQACTVILNCSEMTPNIPRTEAVSILANILTVPNCQTHVLKPESSIQVVTCPDVKDELVNILVQVGRREPTALARSIALSALGIFIHEEFINETFHSKIVDAFQVLLLALKAQNKTLAKLSSNVLFLLCEHAHAIWSRHRDKGELIIRSLCCALCSSVASKEGDKSLSLSLLLCLGEWCMRLGSTRLNAVSLLSLVFAVLHEILTGKSSNLCEVFTKEDKDLSDSDVLVDNLTDKSAINSRGNVSTCAKAIAAHLVIHLGHFPMAIGAANLSSLVVEHDDVPNLVSDELSGDIFSAPNIQLFVLTRNVIASMIELPALRVPGGGATAGLSSADKQVRVLLRHLSGKSSWDASILYQSPDKRKRTDNAKQVDPVNCTDNQKWGPTSLFQFDSIAVNNFAPLLPQRAVRHRAPNVLPDVSNSAPDLDQLDDLLQYLGYTSPECLEDPEDKLNEPGSCPVILDVEREAIASVISQKNVENDHCKMINFVVQPSIRENNVKGNNVNNENAFQRLLFSQLGLATWERRQELHLLEKTERLLREMRNLDSQRCRETHKIAVIYVAPGQEDKNSILSNQGGSMEYEQFLASLAWEVELEGHTGFLGGLQKQGSTGSTAPYYATSLLEAIFHVATRMPGDSQEAVLNKVRHLGNDEVHIVWSEHNRDYRRDIIPTEFCDVLIAIYPLGNGLNRVTLTSKPEVPVFGVLFDEAIVGSNSLAGLVRATVICASRAKRTTLSYYQQYYEERAKSLETVVQKHKSSTTYEDFISQVYNPSVAFSPFRTAGSSITNGRTTSASGSSDNSPSVSSSNAFYVGSGNQSSLAAALIDSHKGSQSHKHNRDSIKGVWFNTTNAGGNSSSSNVNEVTHNIESVSISPRPFKKLSTSLKSVPKRTAKQQEAQNFCQNQN